MDYTNMGLIDVTDLIVPEEEPKYFNDEVSLELYQTCLYLMEEFIITHPSIIADPDFDEIFDENIKEIMNSHFDFDIFYNEYAEDEIDEITATPGAEISGFIAPSYLGPILEKEAIPPPTKDPLDALY